MDAFTQALVDPGKIDIPFENSGPTYEPMSGEASVRSLGNYRYKIYYIHVA